MKFILMGWEAFFEGMSFNEGVGVIKKIYLNTCYWFDLYALKGIKYIFYTSHVKGIIGGLEVIRKIN